MEAVQVQNVETVQVEQKGRDPGTRKTIQITGAKAIKVIQKYEGCPG
jgi:hypothetical protein